MQQREQQDRQGQRRVNLTGSAPVLMVTDVVRAVDYYADCLGFERPELWGQPPCFAMPHRDGLVVMLKQADHPDRICPNRRAGDWSHQWDVYFWVDDSRGLHEELARRGARIAYPPHVQHEYDMVEFAIRDLDGYVLAFGSPLDAAAAQDEEDDREDLEVRFDRAA
jgi:catechol 2,3-dioxygenase-like lactoylglutathione lyase family enzyme